MLERPEARAYSGTGEWGQPEQLKNLPTLNRYGQNRGMYWRSRMLFWLMFLAASFALLAVEASAKSHRVAKGDSLWGLARQYGVSVEALQAANELGASSKIRTGQTLSIPITPKPSPAHKTQESVKRATTSARSVASAKGRKTSPKSRPTKQAAPAGTIAPVAEKANTPITSSARDKAERLYSGKQPPRPPSTLSEHAPAWVLAEPGRLTQGEKPSAARGGVFPCATPDPGFGAYAKWQQVAPMAHVLAPPSGPRFRTVDDNGAFDVLFHFHGREPVRKEWLRAMADSPNEAVLVAIDIGIASEAYRETFSDPRTFGQVLLAVEHELQRRSGHPKAHARNIALSAWSAGFGAIEQLLTQPVAQQRVGSVILLDSLHAGFTNDSLDGDRLSPFVHFAQSAAKGDRFMFVSHSSIRTSGYASSTQSANYLTWKVGGQPRTVTPLTSDPMGLERIASYTQGNFHVRGFRGSGASDHCAQLALMRDVISVHLQPLWESSRAKHTDPMRVANND